MHDSQHLNLSGLPFDVANDLVGYQINGSFDWGEGDEPSDVEEYRHEDDPPEQYSKTIILAIPFKHHFSSFCRSQNPTLCIEYLQQEFDLDPFQLTKFIKTLWEKYPIESFREDSKVANGLGNLMLKAGNTDMNISFLRKVFGHIVKQKPKRNERTEKDVYIFQEGTEKVIGELLKSISWESIKEIVEKAIALTEPSQYKSWMDVASFAGNTELANKIIKLSHAELLDEWYIESSLWGKIYHS